MDWINIIDEPRCLLVNNFGDIYNCIVLIDILKNIFDYFSNKIGNNLMFSNFYNIYKQFYTKSCTIEERINFIIDVLNNEILFSTYFDNQRRKLEKLYKKFLEKTISFELFLIEFIQVLKFVSDNKQNILASFNAKKVNKINDTYKIQRSVNISIEKEKRMTDLQKINDKNDNTNTIIQSTFRDNRSTLESNIQDIKNLSKSPSSNSKNGYKSLKVGKKQKLDLRGIELKTNMKIMYHDSNMIEPDESLTMLKFLRPTNAVLNSSLLSNKYLKYNIKNLSSQNENLHAYEIIAHQNNLNGAKNLGTNKSTISANGKNNDKTDQSKNSNLTKGESFQQKDILNWLFENNIIHKSKKKEEQDYDLKIITKMCSDGTLIADIINALENSKEETIKGIIKNTNKKSNKLLNVRKSLEFLSNKERFESKYLFDAEKIVTGDFETITKFLIDIRNFYCKNKQLLSNSLSRSRSRGRQKKDLSKTQTRSKSNTINQTEMIYFNFSKSINKESYVLDESGFGYLGPRGNFSHKDLLLDRVGQNVDKVIYKKGKLKQPSQTERNDKAKLNYSVNLNNTTFFSRKSLGLARNFDLGSYKIRKNKNVTFEEDNTKLRNMSHSFFLTFDKKNAKRMNYLLDKSFKSMNENKSERNTRKNIKYIHYTDNKQNTECNQPKVDFMKSILRKTNKDNSENNFNSINSHSVSFNDSMAVNNICSLFQSYSSGNNVASNTINSRSTKQVNKNNFGSDVNIIKEWLFSLGIDFADKINFNSNELIEFKDR